MAIFGHAEPRIFTQPARELTTETTLGFEFIEFCRTVLEVQLLPWQEWLAVHALELKPDGGFRFRTIVVLIGRQNGKTSFSEWLAIFFMVVLGIPLTVGTAQNINIAEEVWEGTVRLMEENTALADLVQSVRRANGGKSLELTGGQRYKIAATTRKGGRGLSSDLVLMDELREHEDWDAWGAVTKSTMARPNALVWCMSNAGDAKSVVLRHLRAQAHAQLGDPDGIAAEMEAVPGEDEADLGFFEWSAAPDCLTNDRTAWAMANPSLGYGFLTERALASAEATDPEAVFRTECLCQWVTAKVAQPFPEGAWEAGVDPVSCMERTAVRFFGLDVSADRKRASLAVCGYRADRTWHVEVISSRAGTGWALEWLTNRAAKQPVNLAIQGRGAPVSSFLADISAIKGVNLTLVEGRDLAIYCGRFYDGIVAASGEADAVPVMHRAQPVLDEAARVAQKRAAGDGAWIWDRRGSEIDISPLVACTMAHGLANVGRTETNTTKRYETAYSEARGLLVI